MVAEARLLLSPGSTSHPCRIEQSFPYFRFPIDLRGLYQLDQAGTLNPRHHISTQNETLELTGGTFIDDVVTQIDSSGSDLNVQFGSTGGHHWLAGRKIVLATGAFANVGDMIPQRIKFGVVPHTVVLGEISQRRLPTLNGMPALSYRYGDHPGRFIYFLPPILYPDGRYYLKIGHSIGDSLANDMESLTQWFQGDGDPRRIDWLTEMLHGLLPDLTFVSLYSKSCVTTRSPTGKQFIDQFEDPRFYALLADNGQCAKSADELGFMCASSVTGGQFPSPYNRADFRLVYE